MSLRALPKDLCIPSHRQVPRPPHSSGTGGTGSKARFTRPSKPDEFSALLAVAQRQIRQKRRLHHWQHARQLSLCISEPECIIKTSHPNQLRRLLAHQTSCNPTARLTNETRHRQLIETMKILVTSRAQLFHQCDPVGVLHVNACLLYTGRRIRAIKTDG